MNPQCVVLDSGVFAKLFLDEPDRQEAISLLEHIGKKGLSVVCPDIFVYEVLSIAGQNSVPMQEALEAIESFEQSYLHIAPLSPQHLKKAVQMAEDGHPKSGFPSIYDSAYHVLALSLEGVFITADKRHVAKTAQYGGVLLLNEWNKLEM